MSNINKQYLKQLIKSSKQGREANCIAAEDVFNTYILRHRETIIAIISVNDNDPELLFNVEAFSAEKGRDSIVFNSDTPAQLIFDLLNVAFGFIGNTIFNVKELLLESLRKLDDVDQLAEYDRLIEDYRNYYCALTGEDGLSEFCLFNPLAMFFDTLFNHYGQYSHGVEVSSTHSSDADKVININVADQRFVTLTLTTLSRCPHVIISYAGEESCYTANDVYQLVETLHYKTLDVCNSSILLKPIFSFLGKGLYDYRKQNPTDDIFARIQDMVDKARCVNTQIMYTDELPF